MKISQDKICIQLTDEHGHAFLFKPTPPYSLAYGDILHTFDTVSDIKLCFYAIKKLMEFVEKDGVSF